MPEMIFKELLDRENINESRLKIRNDWFVRMRLLIFLLGAAISGFLLYLKEIITAMAVFSAFMAVLIITVVKHNDLKIAQRRSQTLIAYYGDFLKRLGGEWTTFPDTGEEFVNPKHTYSSDLNLFGPKSLFQLINLTHTFKGRQRLAGLLQNQDTDKAKILERQGAIKELSENQDFIKELSLRGLLNKKTGQNPEKLIKSINSPNSIPGFLKHPLVIMGLPSITLLSALLAQKSFPWLYMVLMAGIIVQLLIFALSYSLVSGSLSLVNQYKNELLTYYQMIDYVEKSDFKDPLLRNLKARLATGEYSASREIRRLSALSDYIDFKLSPLIYFILNALFLWDLNLNRMLEIWKKKNAGNINGWLDALAEFEALSSLAVIPVINPECTYPEFVPESRVTAKGLAHPFIQKDKRVSNDIDLKGIGIITGSNMSGKTTLLRTIGINLVLAYSGAPVLASGMKTGIMSIMTSMRNQDDLNEGVSTFYAELVRIKRIVDKSREGTGMIFLIDEIFKGTNSRDRIEGAKTVLRGLNKPGITGLITTHDYELCGLEAENSALFKNWHFSEAYSNNRIHFDYKLRSGRCTTSNARYLMRMVGLE